MNGDKYKEIKKWDIVMARHPLETAGTGWKVRPVVIISNQQFNEITESVMVMPMTTTLAITKFRPGAKVSQWQRAGLSEPSNVLSRITTLNREAILEKIGHMPELDRIAINVLVQKSLNGA